MKVMMACQRDGFLEREQWVIDTDVIIEIAIERRESHGDRYHIPIQQ